MSRRGRAAVVAITLLAGGAAGCDGRSAEEGEGTTYAVETVEVQTVATTRNCKGLSRAKQEVHRFQLDIKQEALPVKARSRFIDLAAAIVAPRCYLCFQALEANRPIAGGAKLACG